FLLPSCSHSLACQIPTHLATGSGSTAEKRDLSGRSTRKVRGTFPAPSGPVMFELWPLLSLFLRIHSFAQTYTGNGMELSLQANNAKARPKRLVSCLSIDLIGSTKAGLELTAARLDRFNTSLVSQIKPHLEKLGLRDALVKFTGDGWLLMTDEAEKVPVPAFCCLATI